MYRSTLNLQYPANYDHVEWILHIGVAIGVSPGKMECHLLIDAIPHIALQEAALTKKRLATTV